jgi:hypothetical protein
VQPGFVQAFPNRQGVELCGTGGGELKLLVSIVQLQQILSNEKP